MKQRITLSIDEKILKKVRIYCQRKQISPSQLFEKMIDIIDNEEAVEINPTITALQHLFVMPAEKYSKADYYESKRK